MRCSVQRSAIVVIFIGYLCILCHSLLLAQTAIKPLGEGVVLKQYVQPFYNSPQIVNVLEVDLNHAAVRVDAEVATGRVYRADLTQGREVVSATVRRLGALAAINADFFPWTGDPLNLHIQGGELISEPTSERAVFGITSDGVVLFGAPLWRGQVVVEGTEPLPLTALNRPVQANECVLVTPWWGETYPLPNGAVVWRVGEMDGKPRLGGEVRAKLAERLAAASTCPVPEDGCLLVATGTLAERLNLLNEGTAITLRFAVEPDQNMVVLSPERQPTTATLASRRYWRRQVGTDFWKQAFMAVGGGPWLLRDGNILIDASQQGFNDGFTNNRHPRTAVGVTAEGKLLLVTVDGRQPMSAGMTLGELAQLMKQLGATDAINLDGGGSTTLAIRGGLIVNSPSEGRERPVANAIVVYAPRSSMPTPAALQLEPASVTLPSGGNVQFRVRSSRNGETLDPGAVVFGTTGGIGFVDQTGRFTAFKMGKGTVSVLLPDDRVVQAEVRVVAGDPARIILVQPNPIPSSGERFEVAVRVVDRASNPCAGVTVQMRAVGAYPQQDSTTTDANGVARFFVAWDTGASAQDSVLIFRVAGGQNGASLQLQRPR